MIVVMFLLGWLALSVVVVVAYAFGAAVGYRRGVEQAMARTPGSGPLASPDLAVELRLADNA